MNPKKIRKHTVRYDVSYLIMYPVKQTRLDIYILFKGFHSNDSIPICIIQPRFH